MSVEYRVVRVALPMEEEDLNAEGRDGWKLAAVHSTTEKVEVAYNHHQDQDCIDYYFWRDV